jgi:hypothetical protein
VFLDYLAFDMADGNKEKINRYWKLKQHKKKIWSEILSCGGLLG